MLAQKSMIENEKIKEYTAVIAMKMMIEKFAKKYGISINEALKKFTSSKAYDALFDYDNFGLWKESPLYIMEFFEKSCC